MGVSVSTCKVVFRVGRLVCMFVRMLYFIWLICLFVVVWFFLGFCFEVGCGSVM